MVVVSFIFIYQQVGLSAIAGFGVMLCTIPIQSYMSQRFSHIRKVTIGHTDSRVKTVNEILIGATVMKLYAWVRRIICLPLFFLVNLHAFQSPASCFLFLFS